MPSNNIAFARNYTSVIDEVYQRASVSGVLNSGRRMVRAGHNAKEILIPKISVTGLGNYTRNVGYKTGAITYEFETKTFNYDRGIRLFADVMDVEEVGVNDCFVEAGAELQRTQVAPEADAFTFAQIASYTGVTVTPEDLSEATATDILQALREVTSAMDEKQVTLGSRYLFITPTLKGVLDDFSYANLTMSNRVLERFARVIEVPQVRFYTAIDLKSGDTEFGYAKAAAGKAINFMVVEKSAVIKFDKHVASRVFSPDELESLDSYMMKYRKYGIVELFDNKLDGVYVSAATRSASSRSRTTRLSRRPARSWLRPVDADGPALLLLGLLRAHNDLRGLHLGASFERHQRYAVLLQLQESRRRQRHGVVELERQLHVHADRPDRAGGVPDGRLVPSYNLYRLCSNR